MMSAGLLADCDGATGDVAVTGATIGFGGGSLTGGDASIVFEDALIAAGCVA